MSMPRRAFLEKGAVSSFLLGSALSHAAEPRRAPVRLVQIGTTHAHAAGKMEALRSCPEFEVVAVVEPDDAHWAASQRRKEFQGLPRWTEEAVLAARDIPAVAVENDMRESVAVAGRAIQSGKHVLMDKPAGTRLPPFREVIEAARARRLTVQLGYMLRYNPAFEFLERIVQEGWLGRIFSVEGIMGKSVSLSGREPLYPYSGGVMFELACHLVDATVSLLGRPVAVHSHGRHVGAFEDALLDNQLAVLEYPHALATVRSALVDVDGFRRRQFVVCGDQGTLEIRPMEPPKARLILDRPRGEYSKGVHDIEFPNVGRYDAEVLAFARAVRGGKPARSLDHELLTQEVVLRAAGMPLD